MSTDFGSGARNGKTPVSWVGRFIIFHDMRQPEEMAALVIRPNRLPVLLTRDEAGSDYWVN